MKFWTETKKQGEAYKKAIQALCKAKEMIFLSDIVEIFGKVPAKEAKEKAWWSDDVKKKMRLRQVKDGSWFLYLPGDPFVIGEIDELKEQPTPFDNINLTILNDEDLYDLVVVAVRETLFQTAYTVHARPCIVKARKSGPKENRVDRHGYFHRWFEISKGVQQLLGLVEFEDGHVEQVVPTNIIFTDKRGDE